ncbi:hypothetical protein L2E82_42346 [Cichorium intybus]|uniref:Uncharacterized protein n=2 Tax=Cichorium intybus TaxID=13427 RepID=A0ACB8ZLS5_CICIN|nr:hypothetical protein L2E82_41827 [Cichorium intybus]KAI3698644.1 hypothetical protein L2E82_42346 [Cichorium intybus]
MAPGRKRGGAKGAKTKSQLNLGDLVLAKVKGFPAWPAKAVDGGILLDFVLVFSSFYTDFYLAYWCSTTSAELD